jgi:hypothetical protein
MTNSNKQKTLIEVRFLSANVIYNILELEVIKLSYLRKSYKTKCISLDEYCNKINERLDILKIYLDELKLRKGAK